MGKKRKNRGNPGKANELGKRNDPRADKGPIYHHGSTTQGGSDYGQGSSYLGSEAYKQGSEAGKGSTYEGERWVADDANNEPPPPPPSNC